MAVAVAVAVAGSCSTNSTPSLGTSMCCLCSPKMQNKQTNKKPKNKPEMYFFQSRHDTSSTSPGGRTPKSWLHSVEEFDEAAVKSE